MLQKIHYFRYLNKNFTECGKSFERRSIDEATTKQIKEVTCKRCLKTRFVKIRIKRL